MIIIPSFFFLIYADSVLSYVASYQDSPPEDPVYAGGGSPNYLICIPATPDLSLHTGETFIEKILVFNPTSEDVIIDLTDSVESDSEVINIDVTPRGRVILKSNTSIIVTLEITPIFHLGTNITGGENFFFYVTVVDWNESSELKLDHAGVLYDYEYLSEDIWLKNLINKDIPLIIASLGTTMIFYFIIHRWMLRQ